MSKTLVTNRRTALKLLGGGAAALALPYIIRPRPAWAENGVLNITTYDKFLPQEFIDKFQKDTGIEVRTRLTDDQGKQYNLLTAEGANPSTDIVTVAGHRYSQFISSKLLQPLDTGKISNWKNLNTAYQDAPWARVDNNLWGLPILAGYEGLARNVDYVKEAPSWDVMFDPQYKGLTSYIVSDFMTIVMQYLGHDGDFVTYVDKPDVAATTFDKFLGNATAETLVVPDADQFDLLRHALRALDTDHLRPLAELTADGPPLLRLICYRSGRADEPATSDDELAVGSERRLVAADSTGRCNGLAEHLSRRSGPARRMTGHGRL